MRRQVFRATAVQGRSARFQKFLHSGLAKAIGLVVLIVVGFLLVTKLSQGPIPPDIQKQLTSTLYIPASNYGSIDRHTVAYDKANKVLTFRTTVGTTGATMTEQATPDSFTDIPDLYNKLLNGLNEYKAFSTTSGTVHLTKPSQQVGKTVGVLNNAGTLMFVRSDGSPTLDQWQQFFNHLSAHN